MDSRLGIRPVRRCRRCNNYPRCTVNTLCRSRMRRPWLITPTTQSLHPMQSHWLHFVSVCPRCNMCWRRWRHVFDSTGYILSTRCQCHVSSRTFVPGNCCVCRHCTNMRPCIVPVRCYQPCNNHCRQFCTMFGRLRPDIPFGRRTRHARRCRRCIYIRPGTMCRLHWHCHCR